VLSWELLKCATSVLLHGRAVMLALRYRRRDAC